MVDLLILIGYGILFIILAISPFAIGIGLYIWIAHYFANAKYKDTYRWIKNKNKQYKNYKLQNSKEMKNRYKVEKKLKFKKNDNWTPVTRAGKIYLKYGEED